jgi:hypothetical protein
MNFFVGLWPIVWKFIAAGGGAAMFGAIAWYAPGLKTKIGAACIAAVIVATTIAYSVGVRDEGNRCNAQWQAKWDAAEVEAIARGNRARAGAGDAVDRGMRDPQDTDQ